MKEREREKEGGEQPTKDLKETFCLNIGAGREDRKIRKFEILGVILNSYVVRYTRTICMEEIFFPSALWLYGYQRPLLEGRPRRAF